MQSIKTHLWANLAAIKAVDTTNLSNGIEVFIESVKDKYVLEIASTSTVDDIVTVQPSTGPGRWVRQLQSSNEWLIQSTWYINSVSGNDENNGATSGTALKTHGEFRRRIGRQVISQVTTV